MKAIEKGCEKVIGIDGRPMHIEQAELVFQTLEIEKKRYQFINSDIFEIDFEPLGEFDIAFVAQVQSNFVSRCWWVENGLRILGARDSFCPMKLC